MNRKAKYSIILLISGTMMFLITECFMIYKAYQVEKIRFTYARQSMVATAFYRGMIDVKVMETLAQQLIRSADSSGNIDQYLNGNSEKILSSLDSATCTYRKTDSLFTRAMHEEGFTFNHKLSVVVSSFILFHGGREFVICDAVSKHTFHPISGMPDTAEIQKPIISFFFKGNGYNITVSAYLSIEYRLADIAVKLRWQLAGSLLMILLFIWIVWFTISIIRRQIQLDELKNDFINNISHEVKTPLTTMMVAAGALKGKTRSGSENLLQILEKQGERLDTLFSNIINLSVLREGSLNPDFQKADTHEVIRELLEEASLSHPEVTISCKFNSEQPVILADTFYLRTAISNILDNSIKYGSPPLVISISTEHSDNHQIIKISDNGPGIPEKYQKRIFGKFFRVPSGNIHTVKGSGLGLYYVKLIMTKHRGKAVLVSKPGEGTMVKLIFPAL